MTLFSLVLTMTTLAAPGMVADVTYAEYYVSRETGSDATGEGTMGSPWASIGHALTWISPTEINPATVHIAAGIYEEFVYLGAFIDLCGGYSPFDWRRDLAQYETRIFELRTSAAPTVEGIKLKYRGSKGLICTGQADAVIVNCRIEDNISFGMDEGGGIRVFDGASVRVVDCMISGNGPGPPDLFGTTKGGGALHDSTGTAEFVRCTFLGNSAVLGGAIYAERGSIIARDCVFTGNGSSWGASIHAREAASVTLINCRFTDNVVFEFNAVQIYDLYIDGTCTIINCTLAETKGSSDTASIGGATILNSILRGGRISIGGVVSYSNVQGYTGGVGNMNVDPRFVNPAEEDYRLRPASPCIDRATSGGAPDHDLDGNLRPVDIPARGFDGPGEGYDMGCYEYFPSPTPTPTHTPGPTPTPIDIDLNGDGRIDELDLFLFSREWQRSL